MQKLRKENWHTILMSDKTDFKKKNSMRKKTFHKLKGQQEYNNPKFLCTFKCSFKT